MAEPSQQRGVGAGYVTNKMGSVFIFSTGTEQKKLAPKPPWRIGIYIIYTTAGK
jgi:hypothetical protein